MPQKLSFEIKKLILYLLFLTWFWVFFGFVFYAFGIYTISILVGWEGNFLIKLIWFPIILFIAIIISFLIVIKLIKIAKKIGKPIPLKWKIMLFLSPFISSNILFYRFVYVQEWDYSKFKSDNANECFENDNFKYLADEVLTQGCKLDSLKYLKSKFKNVSIVYLDKNTTTFRIGSTDKNAILGKDYILIQKNFGYKWISFYSKRFFLYQEGLKWLHKTNGAKIFHLVCWYSLA